MNKLTLRFLVLLLLLTALPQAATAAPLRSPATPLAGPSLPASVATYFPETGHQIAYGFLAAWRRFGGQRTVGLPLTEEFAQVNASDGRSYTVQYFERARFEYHPEIADPNYQVSLGLLGREEAARQSISIARSSGTTSDSNWYFKETGHNLGGSFLQYWLAQGGLDRFGYPISEEGQARGGSVQYFERARLENHPDLRVSNDTVQPSPLGYAALLVSGLAVPSGALVQMTPPRIAEGRTMLVRVATAPGAKVQGSWRGSGLRFARDDSQPYPGWWTLIAAPVFNGVGNYPLTMTVTEANGSRRPINRQVDVYAGSFPSQNLTLTPAMDGMLDPALDEQERKLLLTALGDSSDSPLWAGTMSWPLKERGRISTGFGDRRGYNGQPVSTFHSGLDLPLPEGTPVLAAAAGRVVFAGRMPLRGNCIILDHGLGVHTVYAHLASIGVQSGDGVTQGLPIGRLGSTGFSTGPNLHWEVRLGYLPVDPYEWLARTIPD